MGAGTLRGAAIVALALAAGLLCGCGSSGVATTSVKPDRAEAAANKAFAAAASKYQDTLTYNVINLFSWTNRLRKQIEAGNLERARTAYVNARGWYGRVEPAAATIPYVQAHIAHPKAAEGFPWIERGLWGGDIAALAPGMRDFHHDMNVLRLKVEHVKGHLEPADLPRDGLASLEAVEQRMLKGREEPHSHIDLVDAAATVEGVRSLFGSMHGGLTSSPSIVAAIKKRFADTYITLGRLEGRTGQFQRIAVSVPGVDFPPYPRRSIPLSSKLKAQVSALARLFDQAAALPGFS